MESSRFDELTKALATSTSRRQALRRIGGILGGTALAGLFPGLAFASNSTCAHFCNAVFGAHTSAANRCISQAAHHQGLCYTCGPAAPTGHPPLCDQVCCSSGQSCCSGTCSDCSCGQIKICNGSCATPCTTNTDCSAGCICASDRSGATYCSPLNFEGNSCGTDCDCPSGQFCGVGEFGGTCAALC